ncbi:MAG: Ig-like domain-containing protein [Acidobacteria bacterium]|nr:Ig-like domain-containing protein [Acidobacteriota bacterium]
MSSLRTFPRAALLALLAFAGVGMAVRAQTPVTYSESFDSYQPNRSVTGWSDTRVGSSRVIHEFTTYRDPLRSSNIVYGDRQSESGEHLLAGAHAVQTLHDDGHGDDRTGYFSTLTTKTFAGQGRFELKGRFLRTKDSTRIGFTFFSSYPEKDQYYLIGTGAKHYQHDDCDDDHLIAGALHNDSDHGEDDRNMELVGFSAGYLTGDTESSFVPDDDRWYWFRIQVDNASGVTSIRARFWADGASEPSTWPIDARDNGTTRLITGRIGMWSGGSGDAFIDDLTASSPQDRTAPTIAFYESNVKLDTATTAKFNRNPAIDVRVTDDLSSIPTKTIKLDGATYTNLTPITTEGSHTLTVHAVDSAGNAADATLPLFIDKTAPTITLLESGQPLPAQPKYKRTAAIEIKVADARSTFTTTATLDGAPYTSLTPITTDAAHVLFVKATDALGNVATVQVTIVVDTHAPAIQFKESGNVLDPAAEQKYKADPRIEIKVTDAVAATPGVTATLDGAAYTSNTPITTPGRHTIAVHATDDVSNAADATLRLVLDKNNPTVAVTVGGQPVDLTRTAVYKQNVAINVTATDATTSVVTKDIRLDGVAYVPGTTISTEQLHTLTVHAVDEVGNFTDVVFKFLLDKAPPRIELWEAGVKLDPAVVAKFRRNAAIEIRATDAASSVTYTATLDGANYVSLTPVASEATHHLTVHATDEAGNIADAALDLIVDKTAPVAAFTEGGNALDPTRTYSWNRSPIAIGVTVTDNLAGLQSNVTLDGSPYVSATPIAAEGPHVVKVHAVDVVNNVTDAQLSFVIDKTGPIIELTDGTLVLDPAARALFDHAPALGIKVTDKYSTSSYAAKLDGANWTVGQPIADGAHTLAIHAVDALNNATDVTLTMLVGTHPPVVTLTVGAAPLTENQLFNHSVTVDAHVVAVSTLFDVAATLDGAPVSLTLPIAGDGAHTLVVTATDELHHVGSVTVHIRIDTKKPVVTISANGDPLTSSKAFAAAVTLNATADEPTSSLTLTVDNAPFTLGAQVTADGAHTVTANATDQAGNAADPVTVTFHIDSHAPAVTLREGASPFPDRKTFNRAIVANADVTSATTPTKTATIDNVAYTLGTSYGVEGAHHLKVTATNAAGLSSVAEADFTIDLTAPTLQLLGNGVAFVEGKKFREDVIVTTTAADNLGTPTVAITLDGHTLEAGTTITEEKEHTIFAQAVDAGGNAADVGPFHFLLDKTKPVLTITVAGNPLANGDKFKTAITPAITVEDATATTETYTLDTHAYTKGDAISGEGSHTLTATVRDVVGNETVVGPLTFVIDTLPPVVTITEGGQPFTGGGKYKRVVKPIVTIQDTSETFVTATLDDGPYTINTDVATDGVHTLKIQVIDELGWPTVIPPIAFTIDTKAPVVVIQEHGAPLQNHAFLKQDAVLTFAIDDLTNTTVAATLDGDAYTAGQPVTTEREHTIQVTVIDELGTATTAGPLSFTIDKTPPVVQITEGAQPLVSGALLDHDAQPQLHVTDTTAWTVVAKVDGADFQFGDRIATEGGHTLDVSVTDAAGWTTVVPTISFFVDKTAPAVTVTQNGQPLESGALFDHDITPVVTYTDLSDTTLALKLDNAPFTTGTLVSAEAMHVLTGTATDRAGHVTTIGPITFTIDKSAPVITIKESGAAFVAKYGRDVVPQIAIDDLTAFTKEIVLDGAPYDGIAPIHADGNHTLTVTATDALHHTTTAPPIHFLIDQTAPVVTVTESGAPFEGKAYNRPQLTPVIAIADTTQTTTTALLNEAQFQSGTAITAEGKYTLSVAVTDELEHTTTVPTIAFAIDRTAPVVELVEDGKPLTSGLAFKDPVHPIANVHDTTEITVVATMDNAPYTLGNEVAAEGAHTLKVIATDEVGLSTTVQVSFVIDKTKPAITITAPAPGSAVGSGSVVVTGFADDAATVDVNGVNATIDPATHTFTTDTPVALTEGSNTITAVGVDKAGNVGSLTITVTVDNRAPDVAIAAPLANACINATQLEVKGVATDSSAMTIDVSVDDGTAVRATFGSDHKSWSATLPVQDGNVTIVVLGKDATGHESRLTVPVRIDTAKPVVTVLESGIAFGNGYYRRPLAPQIRVTEDDPRVAITSTLSTNGGAPAPFATGATIAAEGAYTLAVSAKDCANNTSDPLSIAFVLDVTAPSILSTDPPNGGAIGTTTKAITGTVNSDDVASVVIEGSSVAATLTGRTFTFNGVPLVDGTNRLALVAVDRAGNASRYDLAFTVKSKAPVVRILENDAPIAAGTIFRRPVAPTVTSDDADAHIDAKLNGAAFTSGTRIENDGSYTIIATATDAFNHVSESATATFSVRRTGPLVHITAPTENQTIDTDLVTVTGTVSPADVTSVRVNNTVATVTADGHFTAPNVPLDLGENLLVATAVDAAGNASTDAVSVTRAAGAPAILLNVPADGTVTNRPSTAVIGQVLSVPESGLVKVNATDVPVDSTGVFRKNDFPLTEGPNAINATVTGADGTTASVTVHVTADFTPPVLHVLANGTELVDGTRFATAPQLALDVTDNFPDVTSSFTLDGIAATSSTTIANGGHTLAAVARDKAGNETRVSRSFLVGSSASAGGCGLSGFDPANNATVNAARVTITGRSGAAAVLVNGVRAQLAGGTFAATIDLATEGANTVTVRCADANGTPTADAAETLTLYRYLSAPSIAITSPSGAEPIEVITDKITVTGTISAEATSGDVNGLPIPIGAATWSVPNVRLANGLNIITARARNAAGRLTIQTLRVVSRKGTPQIAITSPISGTQTGATAIDVSGTYTNVDPARITVGAIAATAHPLSDTTGTYSATVAIPANATTTLTATGRNRADEATTAAVQVQNVAGPSISISAPLDDTTYASTFAGQVTVTGTIDAAAGSTVQVNGVNATLTGNAFSAAIDLPAGAATPVVARVTTPDDKSALDSIRLLRLTGDLRVLDSFPTANAVGVDRAVLLLALFSNPLDGATVTAGTSVKLADASGAAITTSVFVDKDAISIAPQAALAAGTTYTLTIAGVKDIAGSALAAPFMLTFTTDFTAPAVAPTVNQSTVEGCLTTFTIRGRASATGARVRLDFEGVSQTATAAANGDYVFEVGLAGLTGFHVARLHEVGGDGTLSPEATVTFRLDCAGPQVLGATLDRAAKRVVIQFSKPMNGATLSVGPTGTIQLTPEGGSAVSGTVALNAGGDAATVETTADLSADTITLVVKRDVKDAAGLTLPADYRQVFSTSIAPPTTTGSGYVSGAVYDATTGRPLAGATLDIQQPIGAFSRNGGTAPAAKSAARLQPASLAEPTILTDARGRYTRVLPEGAYTVRAGALRHTTIWRQVVVSAGAGVLPIDVRLAERGPEVTTTGAAQTLDHGGDTVVTRAAQLSLASGSLPAGRKVLLTSVGGQSLAGLLPLGWSPLAAAEILVDESTSTPLPGAKLTFTLTAEESADAIAAAQPLSLVAYDNDRDEWRAVAAVLTPNADTHKVTVDISLSGNYALVFADKGTGLVTPPAATAGAALRGVDNPCVTPTDCSSLAGHSFDVDPKTVLPTQRSTAKLVVEGGAKKYPSGTAVQAFIDEQLNLADGTTLVDPPFATDLLLYRTLKGDFGTAFFHLAPTTQAASVTLRDGVDHIRVVEYPGRIDRGALIGVQGGRVPGDDKVAVEIPAGATSEALSATVASLSDQDLAAFGTVAGFRIAAGFTFAMTRANAPKIDLDGDGIDDPIAAPELLKPARATVTLPSVSVAANAQVIVVEVLDKTPFGAMLRLAARTTLAASATDTVRLFTTTAIDPTKLPVDGILRNGRYLVLVSNQPIAFAWGDLRLGAATGTPVANGRVTSLDGATVLGVADLTRFTGIFAVPIVAQPASQFVLVPRSTATGDGVAYTAAAVEAGRELHVGSLPLQGQAPRFESLTPADNAILGATDTFLIQAKFRDEIDSASVANGILLRNADSGALVPGVVVAAPRTDGTGSNVTFTLAPGATLNAATSYVISVEPSLRGRSGTPFGQTLVFHFSTRANNAALHTERIHISIPDAQGRATVTGLAGSLPAGAQAVAVRRGTDFITRYQTTATSDGSFTFQVGTNAEDAVTLTDEIDLQILDPLTHGIIAVVPLTPFVDPNGHAFIAPPTRTVTFTTAENITITVPAGAFDVPTRVEVGTAAREVFASVPSFDAGLTFLGGVNVQFDGIAKKQIDLSVPTPSGFDTSRGAYLGQLGMSVRGPRIMVVDAMRLDGGDLTTALGGSAGKAALRVTANNLNGLTTAADVKAAFLGIIASGSYIAMAMNVSPTWAMMSAVSPTNEIFVESLEEIFAWAYGSRFYLSQKSGKVLMPMPSNVAVKLVGVDGDTGITVFERQLQAAPPGDPLTAAFYPTITDKAVGPYPTYVSPGRLEVVDLISPEFTDDSRRGISLQYENDILKVTKSTTNGLPNNIHIEGFNVARGNEGQQQEGLATPMSIKGKPGDRIILLIGEKEVDPTAPLQVVFDKPIQVPDQLSDIISLQSTEPGSTDFVDITSQADLKIDSGDRRIRVILPASLGRGKKYRIVVRSGVKDASGLLQMGQQQTVDGTTTTTSGGPVGAKFDFLTRAPGGKLGTFDLPSGSARDMALSGNVLFMNAQEGGVFAYDVSDPAALTSGQVVKPFASSQDVNQPSESFRTWALATDNHGRLWTTVQANMFGYIQSYRVEDFIARKNDGSNSAGPCGEKIACHKGSSIVSYSLGTAANIPQGDSIVTTKPEAIPRKMQVLVQDFDTPEMSLQEVINQYGATVTPIAGAPEWVKLHIPITYNQSGNYWVQRTTFRNKTLGLSWSTDVTRTGTSAIDGVIGRTTDKFVKSTNMTTYGVITLFGFGVGVYDLNAVDSNDWTPKAPDTQTPITEQVLITDAKNPMQCDKTPPPPVACDPVEAANNGRQCAIPDLSLAPEAMIIPVRNGQGVPNPLQNSLVLYGLHAAMGVLDLKVVPPQQLEGDPNVDPLNPRATDPSCKRPSDGLVLARRMPTFDHPRLNQLRTLYNQAQFSGPQGASLPQPWGRFNSSAIYTRTPVQTGASVPAPINYGLVAARDYGLLVLKLDANGKLTNDSLVDVVWTPAGAYSVRVIPGAELASVVDGAGRILLIDLGHIDESAKVSTLSACADITCQGELFPSAMGSLQGAPAAPVPGQYWVEVGKNDPRILWQSKFDPNDPNTSTLAPIIDPETGILYQANIDSKTVKIVAASDPRIRIVSDLGKQKLEEVGGITPLGITPQAGLVNCSSATCTGSAAAFRIEVSLPGSMAESLGAANNTLRLAVESEVVPGSASLQMPDPLPRAHLRQRSRAAIVDPRAPSEFKLTRLIPEVSDPDVQKLRFQRAWNRFISPWIVAVADPRASEKWTWPANTTTQNKEDAGCHACERPSNLKNKPEPDVFELYTAGRFIDVRPEYTSAGTTDFGPEDPGSATQTGYAYLGSFGRLEKRIPTIMADTIRPTPIAVAGQAPPVANGRLLETTYLHSGEVETSTFDLLAAGRAGIDVAVDRTYRSRTMGASAFGFGWESILTERLRLMPDANVEYRDAAGEVWTFKPLTNGATPSAPGEPVIFVDYQSPAGLFLKLSRIERGWRLQDQRYRCTYFDEYGRLVARSDQFADPLKVMSGNDKGNVVYYLYAPDGRLAKIVDPVNRTTNITWYSDADTNVTGNYPGLLKEIVDWRGRKVTYRYDASGRLVTVLLPEAAKAQDAPNAYDLTGSKRPFVTYGYQGPFTAYNDVVELSGNLTTTTDPAENAGANGGVARVEFAYGLPNDANLHRDRVETQIWPCASYTTSCAAKSATFAYADSTPHATVVDILGQKRTYELETSADQHKHVAKMQEVDVPVLEVATIPAAAPVTMASSPKTRETVYHYTGQGVPDRVITQNLRTLFTVVPAVAGSTRIPGEIITEVRREDRVGQVGNRPSNVLVTKIDFDNAAGADPLRTATPIAVSKQADGGALVKREVPSPSSGSGKTVEMTDGEVKTKLEYDDLGQLARQSRLATGGSEDPSFEVKPTFYPAAYQDATNKHLARGRLQDVDRSGRKTHYDYKLTSDGGEIVVEHDLDRLVDTTTRSDAAGRVISVKVAREQAVLTNETFGYDASGHLRFHRRIQSGLDNPNVDTTAKYDALGRAIETTTTNAIVAGTAQSLTVRWTYDLSERRTTTTDPQVGTAAGVVTETTMDALGRVTSIERHDAGNTMKVASSTAYDYDGNPAFETDGVRTSTLRTYDSFGRTTSVLQSDGTLATVSLDAWDQPVETTTYAKKTGPTRAVTSRQTFSYTNAGRTKGSNAQVDAERFFAMREELKNGGAVTLTATAEVAGAGADITEADVTRVMKVTRDKAGRVIETLAGEGSGVGDPSTPPAGSGNQPAQSRVFRKETFSGWDGDLPSTTLVEEPRAATAKYTSMTNYDALGRAVDVVDAGNAQTHMDLDEAGNVRAVRPPGFTSSMTSQYDGRGLAVSVTHPDNRTVDYTFDALGNPKSRTDEAEKTTTYGTDPLGRTNDVAYPDATGTKTVYENTTGLVAATKDRAGLWLSYYYDAAGRVTDIYEDATPRSANPSTTPAEGTTRVLHYDYDEAGRLHRAANKSAACEYEDYDLYGRPRRTRSVRYANESGLDASPKVADVHTQEHYWSVYGAERLRWRMPAAGQTVPATDPDSSWRGWITEEHDAGGNNSRLGTAKSAGGASPNVAAILESNARGFGRPASRTRTLTPPYTLLTDYGYADPGTDSGTTPRNGMPNKVGYWFGDYAMGGTKLERDSALRAHVATDIGLQDRNSTWNYDTRGRLREASLVAAKEHATTVTEGRTVADFRTRSVNTDDTIHDALGSQAKTVEPQSWTAEQDAVHAMIERTVGEDGARTYDVESGRRKSDSVWTYSYDELQRVTRMVRKVGPQTTASQARRIDFEYDPNGRVVGRRACSNTDNETCVLDTTHETADGLPADVTFVWDPITDRLVSIFRAGLSQPPDGSPSGTEVEATAGLLRQYVHGDRAMDDPVEVLVADGGSVKRYLSLSDEAATGSLQTVVNGSDGTIVERVLYADSYGDAPRYIQGALVDKITLEVKAKDGVLQEMTIKAHLTEKLNAPTVANGVRLAAMKGEEVLQTSTATPTTENDNTIVWKVTPSDWTAMSTAADVTSIEIAMLNSLRAGYYGNQPIMSAPSWADAAFGVRSAPDRPTYTRLSIATINAIIAAPPAAEKTLYEVPDLYLAASTTSHARLFTDFQLLPYREPANGAIFARTRWYDPSTGTWLTPDPMGYVDSSNLYAAFGMDPVNGRDPLGLSESIRASMGFEEDIYSDSVGRKSWGYAKAWAYSFYNITTFGFVSRHDDLYETWEENGDRGAYWRGTGVEVGRAGVQIGVTWATGGLGAGASGTLGMSILRGAGIGAGVGALSAVTGDIYDRATGGAGYTSSDYFASIAGGGVLGGVMGGVGFKMQQRQLSETGARRIIDPERIDAWDRAERIYDDIRADASDVSRIAKNTGWAQSRVARIKEHLFFREHGLDAGIKRFDADPDIANAWSRLAAGDHVPSDVDLLRHEIFESKFESLFRTNYRTAHNAALRAGRNWAGE